MHRKLQRLPARLGRVALIDDEADVRDSISAALESADLSCSSYVSAESFLEQGDIDKFSCLLIDVQLPGMSGIELLTTLNSRGCETPVIAMSGHATVVDVVRAYENRARAFLQKPVPVRKLIETVTRLVLRFAERRKMRLAAERIRDALSPREREVMQLLIAGDKTVQIARKLQISPSTVEKHRLRIFSKTGTSSVVDLIHRVPSVAASELHV